MNLTRIIVSGENSKIQGKTLPKLISVPKLKRNRLKFKTEYILTLNAHFSPSIMGINEVYRKYIGRFVQNYSK